MIYLGIDPGLTATGDGVVVTFTVPGVAVGKQSARTAGGHTYVPTKSRNFMNLVTAAAATAMGDEPPFEGPVSLGIEIVILLPKSRTPGPRSKRIAPYWCITRPDTSNVLKAVEDGCTGVVWRDDAQVVEHRLFKHYGPTPGVRVVVRALLPPEP